MNIGICHAYRKYKYNVEWFPCMKEHEISRAVTD